MSEPSRIADYVTLGTSRVFVPEGYRLDVLAPFASGAPVNVAISEERGSSVTVSIVAGGTLAIPGRAYVTPATAGLIAHYARVGDAPTWGTMGAFAYGSDSGTPLPLFVDSNGELILSPLSSVRIGDPNNITYFPVSYNSGNAPASGMWRGYAVATASGEVEVNGVNLGSATAAGQTFFFTMFVAQGSAATFVNCSVVGGGISL
jgi:hypothetical protein